MRINRSQQKLLLALMLVCTASLVLLMPIMSAPKNLLVLESGQALNPAKALSEFELLNHKQQTFTREDLQGQWHILAYGYTQCPDICPTTLMLLTQLKQILVQQGRYQDVGFLFYSIDPKRDTSEKLAQYVAYFGESFVGIRQGNRTGRHLGFEKSLAIKALISRDEKSKQVQVSHGIALYILDPQGKLQAVLSPAVDPFGKRAFTLDAVVADYLRVRQFTSNL